MNKWSRIGLILLILPVLLFARNLRPPEEHFGFKMGTDRKLINWKQIHDYFSIMDQFSDKIKVEELGKTTLGRPFIIAYISSSENLKNLHKFKKIQRLLANPDSLSPKQADKLIKQGKLVMLISLNIHSTEIASSQESVELAYDLITNDDPQTLKILDNVILILIPSLNPDGQQMITDWYLKHAGTEYEGSPMPGLYHYYAGHDNNRDWFFFNLKESQLVAPILYQQWFPQIVFDQHQMSSKGPRMFLPPYKDPINPNVPSVLLAEVNMLGKHLTADLHEKGFTGIVNGMLFNSFFEGTMSKTPLWHNMIGILSELASVRIATPLYFPRGSLGKYGAEISRYSRGTNFLTPWQGGWWRLRDIIEYEKAATFAMLNFAVKYKEKIMKNFYALNREGIDKGRNQAPFQVIIPLKQHDPNAAALMLERLKLAGVRIFKAEEAFEYDGRRYSPGSFIIPLSQPIRAYVKDLFEVQKYPDLYDYPDGPPTKPYDYTGWTLPLQMGVSAKFTSSLVNMKMSRAESFVFDEIPEQLPEADYYLLPTRYNNSFAIINELLSDFNIQRAASAFQTKEHSFPAGTFIIPHQNSLRQKLLKLSEKYRVPVIAVNQKIKTDLLQLKRPRLAIYQPWAGNIDEGWKRLVLDNFKFKYSVLHNKDIQKGKLLEKYDAVIIPDMTVSRLVDGKKEKDKEPLIGVAKIPEKFKGGIGEKGVKKLKEFILQGGTLLTLGRACDFAIDKLRVPAINVVSKKTNKEYFAPGALLRMHLDLSDPITFGMPEITIVRYTNGPAFRLLTHSQASKAVGYFDEDTPLVSGWLIGAKLLAGKTALAEIPTQKGRVILFGARVQGRAQTHGTFKLLFNAILSSKYTLKVNENN